MTNSTQSFPLKSGEIFREFQNSNEELNIYEILPWNHAFLSSVPASWDFNWKASLGTFFKKMLFANMMYHKGLGLSANQIGFNHRVFCLSPMATQKQTSHLVFFNPTVEKASDEDVLSEEGCLSNPGIFVKIKRPYMIDVVFQDCEGNVEKANLHGLAARAFQHEMDHLEGLNFINRASQVHRQIAYQKRKKYLRQFKNALREQAELEEARAKVKAVQKEAA